MTKTSEVARMRLVSGDGQAEVVAELEARLAATARQIEEIRADVGHLRRLQRTAGPEGRESQVEARLLTVGQAAAALGLGESTVHGLIRSGRLGSRKIGGARRVPVAELDRFVSELPSGS